MKTIYLATTLALLTAPTWAATVSVSGFSKSAYTGAVSTMSSMTTQNFESHSEGNVDNGFAANVGRFSTLGGKGTGSTVTRADFDNDGTKLALRDGNVYGRVSTTKSLTGDRSHGMFLDSNDTLGIVWNVALGGQKMFDRIVFTVTDAAEFGNTMWIGVNGERAAMVSSAGRGKKRIVEISFDRHVSEATITLGHFKGRNPRTNDGFSMDDIAVNEVPLPATALLLLGGLGGLAALRRRKG